MRLPLRPQPSSRYLIVATLSSWTAFTTAHPPSTPSSAVVPLAMTFEMLTPEQIQDLDSNLLSIDEFFASHADDDSCEGLSTFASIVCFVAELALPEHTMTHSVSLCRHLGDPATQRR